MSNITPKLTGTSGFLMGISENFLVNTKSFDPIIKALVERSDQPETISDQLLEKMGYNNPSDLLVLHVLRGLDIIAQDKTPTDLYLKMVDPKTTKEAIARGVINGYGELFEQKPDIHKMLPGEIQEELKEYFGDKKTDLIIKYIANTFQKLVSYAGFQNVEKARNAYLEEKSIPVESDAPPAEARTEESSSPDIADTMSQDSVKSRSVEEILFGDSPPDNGNHKDPGGEEHMEPEAEPEESLSKDETPSEGEDEPEEIEETEAVTSEELEVEMESEADDAEEVLQDEEPVFESDIQEYKPEEGDVEQEEAEEINSKKLEERRDQSPATTNFDLSNRRVQKALIRRADLQYKLEYYPEALESIKLILSYFDDADEAVLREAVKNAVIQRVEILNKLDKKEGLLPALNEVINRFSESGYERYYRHASMAMLQKTELLEESDYDREDLLPLYDAIIERLEESSDVSVQDKVTDIFAKRLELLAQSGGRSEFLEALGTSIVRFKDAKRYRKYLEEAMFRKAELLEKMERNEEALDAYNAFLEEFGQAIEI